MILPVKLGHLSPKAAKRTAIPIIILVIVSIGKVFWVRQLHVRGDGGDKRLHYTRHVKSVKVKVSKISYLDFLIRHPITDTRIEFIQGLPSQLGIVQVLRRLDCALESGRPYLAQGGHHYNERVFLRAGRYSQWRIANIVFDEVWQSRCVSESTL
jgi:hypothetical protein